MGNEEKLSIIGGLSFVGLSLLFFMKDSDNVFLSLLIPIYYLCSLSALLTVALVCGFVLLELWYPNVRARYVTTNSLYRYLTSGLLFSILCTLVCWILCIGSRSLSDYQLCLVCCTIAAAISASCQKTEKSVARVTAVQQVTATSTLQLIAAAKPQVEQQISTDVEEEAKKDEDEPDSTETDFSKKYVVEANIEGLPSKRRRTALELLQTEATYLKNLTIVIQMFKDPLEKLARECASPPLAQPDIDSAFGGLPAIKSLHDEIYRDLKALIDDWVEECSIGEIMCKYEDRLIKAYPPYVNYFDMGKELIAKRRKECVELDKFLLEATMHPNCMHQPLDALLIRPVQRLPSMSLLMKDLRKRTPEDIKDHFDLEKAENALKNVLSHVNEDKRRFEQKMKIFDIVYQVDNCPPNLISADRRFIARLEVITLNDGLYRSGERLALYLLSDKLEVAKWRRRPSYRSPFLLKHIKLLSLEKVDKIYTINDCDEFKSLYAIKYSGEAYNDNDKASNGALKISVLESLDPLTYKKQWIEAIADQVCQARTDVKPNDITVTLGVNEFADMFKKGTKIYKRLKSVRNKND